MKEYYIGIIKDKLFNYTFCFFLDAYQHVKENLSELNGKAGANETDLVFLRGLLDSTAVTQLIKVSHIKKKNLCIYCKFLNL